VQRGINDQADQWLIESKARLHIENFLLRRRMKRGGRHPIWNWVIHTPWVLAVVALLAVMVFFGSGAGNPLLSELLVSRLERMTGGKVELRALSIRWFAMRATIKGLVIHGREPAGTEPLFTAEEVQAGCVSIPSGPPDFSE